MKENSHIRPQRSAKKVLIEVFQKDVERLRKISRSLPDALHQLLTQRKNRPSGFHTPPQRDPRSPQPAETPVASAAGQSLRADGGA